MSHKEHPNRSSVEEGHSKDNEQDKTIPNQRRRLKQLVVIKPLLLHRNDPCMKGKWEFSIYHIKV